jgi:D-amino-acid dehydrogenase
VKVLVLGAGVVGTTTAWFLARDGHQVTVVDRQPAAGLETSFANGGQVSVSHATPWATPRTPWKALRWLGRRDAPLVVRWGRRDPALWGWLLRFLVECAPGRSRANAAHTVRLALYSRSLLKEVRAETRVSYDHLERGILHIFRNQREFAVQCRWAEVMAAAGLPQEILAPAEMLRREPSLRDVAEDLVGGIWSPDDESGDAHRFTQGLAARAAEAGATFRFGEDIHGLDTDGGRVSGVRTERGRLTADAYVLALGSWSPLLVRPLGLRLPIYPAKGYSVTIPVGDAPTAAPMVSITDDEHKMVYSRLGNRLRAAGTAELAGWNRDLTPRVEVIRENARRLFPRAGDFDRAEPWTGLRPKTPDSAPHRSATYSSIPATARSAGPWPWAPGGWSPT